VLELLGADGRGDYALLLVTFDVVFPATLALVFSSWFSVLLAPRAARIMRAVAFATLALDYAENVVCGALVATFPDEPVWLAALQGVLTAVKLAGYALSTVALLAGAARKVLARSRHRAPSPDQRPG